MLRHQQKLDRFRRRGLAAVRCEFALHAMAYNLARAVALLRAISACFYATYLALITQHLPGRLRFVQHIAQIH